jgi:hypothetical protein
LKYGIWGKKGCQWERNLKEIYTDNTMFWLLSVFVLFLLTHNRIWTNKGGGAQNFLGPRGVKYLNTGLLPSGVSLSGSSTKILYAPFSPQYVPHDQPI